MINAWLAQTCPNNVTNFRTSVPHMTSKTPSRYITGAMAGMHLDIVPEDTRILLQYAEYTV